MIRLSFERGVFQWGAALLFRKKFRVDTATL